MAKAKTNSFIIELKLNTNLKSEYILNKRFEIARKMYNTTLKFAIKQLNEMRPNKTYKQTLNKYLEYKKLNDKRMTKEVILSPTSEAPLLKENIKLYSELLNSIKMSYSLTEYQLHTYINFQRQMYKEHIDVNTAQKIASTVYKAVEDVLYKKGKKLHFKKFSTLTSLEGKDNKMGIKFRFSETKKEYSTSQRSKFNKLKDKNKKIALNKLKKQNRLEWNGLILPVIIRKDDLFIQESLETHKIKYCRIIRKPFYNDYKYFIQLVMEGLPPAKRNKDGSFRHTASPNNKVGIDIGTSTIAVCSKDKLILTELAPNSVKYDKEIHRLQRKLERSKRATNPHNFNVDGTIKRGVKLTWVHSKSYKKILFKLKNLYRLKSNYIKLEHNKLSNEILSLGDEVYVEMMRFNALQKRSKETTINETTGRFNKKKRFGRSLNNKAPSKLLTIIDRKLKYEGLSLSKVNTNTFRASQYNHIEDKFIKKSLNKRWNNINKEYIQRDLYSSFLLMNSKENLKETDRTLCIDNYEEFKIKHNKLIEQMSRDEIKYPKSFGIKKIAKAITSTAMPVA